MPNYLAPSMLDSKDDGGTRQIFNEVGRGKYRDGVATITFLFAFRLSFLGVFWLGGCGFESRILELLGT